MSFPDSSTASSHCSRILRWCRSWRCSTCSGSLRASFADPVWATPTTLFTGFAFTGMIYFVFCFGMSRYSLFVEHRLNAHRRS